MHASYANIILRGPNQADVIAVLNELGAIAYVSPTQKNATAVFHEDLSGQEYLAAALSGRLGSPALLSMTFGGAVLLYQLYLSGQLADSYVSEPHPDLELDSSLDVSGDAAALCAAFDADRKSLAVERILRRPTTAAGDYALAVNRHGELLRALGLPLLAAGTGFASIETGEAIHAEGPTALLAQSVRTGG